MLDPTVPLSCSQQCSTLGAVTGALPYPQVRKLTAVYKHACAVPLLLLTIAGWLVGPPWCATPTRTGAAAAPSRAVWRARAVWRR